MSNLEWALDYAAAGLHVFPLVPRSKRPLTSNGFKDATTDETQIRQWWTSEPDAGIAIATGASGLAVLDFDKKHGGLETYESIREQLSPTLTVRTGGGGYHLYYRGETKSRAGVLPGLDIRSTGGYVVAPPSIHESGETYQWTDEDEIAGLPDFAFLKKPEPAINPGAATELPDGVKGELNKRTLKFLTFGAKPGQWHQEFYQAAMNLKQNGYTLEEAKMKLQRITGILDDEHDWPQLLDVYENRETIYPPDLSVDGTNEAPARAAATSSLSISAAELFLPMTSYLKDKDKVRGEPTGLAGLDVLLGGGKRTGEVTAWHAEAKTGKNTLWHKLMFLWQTIPQGYASRELTPEAEVLPNLLSLAYQENAWLAEMNPARIENYRLALESWPIHFAKGYGHFPLDEIKRWVNELREHGVRYFWFDHLHYMLEDPEDHKAASKLIKEIKTMAKENDIHVDLIIQPNKLAEGQRLSLNSIKGGSAMGQAIDNLFVLERVKGQRNICKLTLDVARSKLCKPGKIFLEYNPETTDFIEVEEITEPVTAPYTLRDANGG